MSDIEALQTLVNTYNMMGDRMRLDEMGALFGEDGVLETADWRAVGAEGVKTQLGDDSGGGGGLGPLLVRHNLTTSLVDVVDAERATGRHYFLTITDVGPDNMGVYVDQYRKVRGEWRVAHRRVQIDWVSELSPNRERHLKAIPARRWLLWARNTK